MAHFARIPMEKDRAQYLNLDQVRVIEDNPDEGSVRVEFDSDHRIYLDRERAAVFLRELGKKES